MIEMSGYQESAERVRDETIAAFEKAADREGITGFQANWIALEVLAHLMPCKPPFAVIQGEQLLYPQYDLEAKVAKWLAEWRVILAPRARELIAGRDLDEFPISARVMARWQEIAKADEQVEVER